MTKPNKKQPLQCEVIDDRLVISIGIDTLAWTSKKRNGGPLSNKIKIDNQLWWARDVANALAKEDEIGNTMLTDVLDEAIIKARDNGSVGLLYETER